MPIGSRVPRIGQQWDSSKNLWLVPPRTHRPPLKVLPSFSFPRPKIQESRRLAPPGRASMMIRKTHNKAAWAEPGGYQSTLLRPCFFESRHPSGVVGPGHTSLGCSHASKLVSSGTRNAFAASSSPRSCSVLDHSLNRRWTPCTFQIAESSIDVTDFQSSWFHVWHVGSSRLPGSADALPASHALQPDVAISHTNANDLPLSACSHIAMLWSR